MQHVPRIMVLPLFAATLSSATWAKEDSTETGTALNPKAAEYKRSDANFYLKSDIVKVNPNAVIIAKGGYTQTGDSYFYTPKIKAPKTLQFEVLNDWIEPITPPDAPPALAIAPDAMQVREPQGDVTVAMPSAPGNFVPVADGMPLVNGAVIKTGANATAAVLFGGVFSARLMPNSAAAVQQTVTPTSRSVEVDLTSGGVFSKVGQQVGVKGEYEVHTPFGDAVARGTDFVTITTGTRTDVWVAQGTVSLEPPNSKATQMATSDGTGALKMMRFPLIADAHQVLTADAETLTMIFNFIPMANQKIAALRAKVTRGEPLTPGQQNYLGRIKEVPSLIKLALVEKAPEPTPMPVPTPPVVVKREPAAEGGTVAAPTPPPPPITITLGPGDKVNFEGADTTVTKLKARLAQIAKATPTQPLEIARDTSVGPILLKRVADACHHAKLDTKVLDATPAPIPATPAAPATTASPASDHATAATPPPAPKVEAAKPTPPKAAPVAASPKAKTTTPPAQPKGPITVAVHPNGSIKFQGSTITLAEFQTKLTALIKKMPEQELIITSGTNVPYDKLKAVLDSCDSAHVRHLTVASPSPAPPPMTPSTTSTTPESPANNLPAPTLLMHPSMETMSSNAPPIAPSSPPDSPSAHGSSASP